jgi:hypothetical protein
MKKLIVLFAAIALWSCDKIDDPLKPVVFSCGECQASVNDPFIVAPNAVIEEFTGHTCNNCPNAALEVKRIIDNSPSGRVYTVGIHAGPLASPTPPDYPSDFVTDDGNQLWNWDKPLGVPVGRVNRLDYGDLAFNKLSGNWGTETDNIIQGSVAKVGLFIETVIDTATRELCLQVKFKAMEDLSGRISSLRWSAFLTEGNIVAPQKMPDNSKNKDYVHEHVFRDAINGDAWGQPIQDFTGAQDEVSCQTISYVINDNWVIENCEVIVMVHDDHNVGGNGEILQVVGTKL